MQVTGQGDSRGSTQLEGAAFHVELLSAQGELRALENSWGEARAEIDMEASRVEGRHRQAAEEVDGLKREAQRLTAVLRLSARCNSAVSALEVIASGKEHGNGRGLEGVALRLLVAQVDNAVQVLERHAKVTPRVDLGHCVSVAHCLSVCRLHSPLAVDFLPLSTPSPLFSRPFKRPFSILYVTLPPLLHCL